MQSNVECHSMIVLHIPVSLYYVCTVMHIMYVYSIDVFNFGIIIISSSSSSSMFLIYYYYIINILIFVINKKTFTLRLSIYIKFDIKDTQC